MISTRLRRLYRRLLHLGCVLRFFRPRDTGAYPLVLERFPEPISVTAAIPKQPVRLWQTSHHGAGTGSVGVLGGRTWCATWCSCRPWFDRLGAHAPLYHARIGRCSVCFEVGRIDHHGLFLAAFRGQTHHHPGEDALVALPLPADVERLVWARGRRGIAPTQPIAIDEDNPAQDTPVIDAWLAMGLREVGLQTSHLRIA